MATRIFWVRFDGGPEDGTLQEYATPPPLPKTWNWGGDIYERGDITSSSGRTKDHPLIYRYNRQASKLAAPGLAGVTAAWTRLMRALAHKAPTNMARVHSSTVHIRRLTRNHH